MTKTSMKINIFAVLALFASASFAEIGDGKWFLEACSNDSLAKIEQESKEKRLSQLAYCSAFVMGILQGHYASRAKYKQPPLFCAPQGRTYLEFTGDVIGIVQSQPEKQKAFTSALALHGLTQLYPCKN